MIFLDHIPSHRVIDVASWVTIRNYGFSDAAEIFIFVSGYTASLVYGRKMWQQGFAVGSARILRRVWQIYVAHLLLFAFYVAEVGYAAAKFGAPNFENYTHTSMFFRDPGTAMAQALLLHFKPVDLDVLPVYILVLGASRRPSGSCSARRTWFLPDRRPSMHAYGCSAGIFRLIRTGSGISIRSPGSSCSCSGLGARQVAQSACAA